MKEGLPVHLANLAAITQYKGLKYSEDFADVAHLLDASSAARLARLFPMVPSRDLILSDGFLA